MFELTVGQSTEVFNYSRHATTVPMLLSNQSALHLTADAEAAHRVVFCSNALGLVTGVLSAHQ